ncbi:MAG TPA: S-adenosylmethionine decarboxylase [Magnetospirillaceae bacterium]|nr:S-adenosylmethionine decarboxylase [Magnetospirillaceae bacterium]
MIKRIKGRKIKLEGFNNLTKSMSFNIYDLCYARSREAQIEYLEYVDEEYNSGRLESIVEEVTRIINARLVNVSTQDYDPRGASVVALINEDHPMLGASRSQVNADSACAAAAVDAGIAEDAGDAGEAGDAVDAGPPEAALSVPAPGVIGHLDKSHIAIHTYPEYNQLSGIASFRVDVDISTCGMISPLSALQYLIESFDSEIVIMDYRVRGFTRDNRGRKLFIDQDISSIQDYIVEEVLDRYVAYDVNIVSDNNFHTKMRKKAIKLKDYLFGDDVKNLGPKEKKRIKHALTQEIQEIFECRNLDIRGGKV